MLHVILFTNREDVILVWNVITDGVFQKLLTCFICKCFAVYLNLRPIFMPMGICSKVTLFIKILDLRENDDLVFFRFQIIMS